MDRRIVWRLKMIYDKNDFDPNYNGFYKHVVKGPESPHSGYDEWLNSLFEDGGTTQLLWRNSPPIYF